MRLLIVGDSHCRHMQANMKISHSHIQTLVVFRPQAIEYIAESILNTRRNGAIEFDPDHVIIHCGHNNIVPHPVHNTNPLFSQSVIDLQIQLAQEIQIFLPNCTISCSTIYPRSFTDSSAMNKVAVADYNTIAKRYGQRLRASCIENNLTCGKEFRNQKRNQSTI
jgi:hypothetical protein